MQDVTSGRHYSISRQEVSNCLTSALQWDAVLGGFVQMVQLEGLQESKYLCSVVIICRFVIRDSQTINSELLDLK